MNEWLEYLGPSETGPARLISVMVSKQRQRVEMQGAKKNSIMNARKDVQKGEDAEERLLQGTQKDRPRGRRRDKWFQV